MRRLLPILALCCAPAFANVTASVVSGCGTASAVKNSLTNKWEVTLVVTSSGCPTTFSVQGTPGSSNEPIRYIHVYNPYTSSVLVDIGTEPTTGRIGNIEEIRGHDGAFDPETVFHIRSLYINGTLGNNAASPTEEGQVWCQNWLEGHVEGDVENTVRLTVNGKLGTLYIGGSLHGSINGPNEVDEIFIVGDLGRVGNGSDGIRVDQNIAYLSVGGDVNGLISNLWYEPFWGVTGSVGRVEVGGDFHGDLETEWDAASPPPNLDPGIYIDGDLTGSLTVRYKVSNTIRVGGSFASGARINIAEDGLEGQITFNRNAGAGTWAGQIVRDLDADEDWVIGGGSADAELVEEYAELPSAIGGGAAGLASFTMHESTASPANNSIRFITAINILDPMMSCYDLPFEDDITFRLYGPASLVSGTGPHANVEVWDGSAWVDAGFDVETSIVGSTGSRGLKFERKDGMGNQIAWPQTVGLYRIVPVTGRIVSADVLGAPTADFEYHIELAEGCSLSLLSTFDLNDDDTLCAQDIAAWTTNPVDFNDDSTADGDDATLLLRAVDAFNALN